MGIDRIESLGYMMHLSSQMVTILYTTVYYCILYTQFAKGEGSLWNTLTYMYIHNTWMFIQASSWGFIVSGRRLRYTQFCGAIN